MRNDESNEVILIDDHDEESRFEHVLTFMHENERYVALSPLEGDGEESPDEAEVVIFRIEEQDGGDVYVSVDNEVLLNEVFETFLDLMDELDEEP